MLKALIIRKLVGSFTSSTMGVAGLMLAGAAWVAAHPELAAQISPKWGGTIVAGAAFAVAIARARSL